MFDFLLEITSTTKQHGDDGKPTATAATTTTTIAAGMTKGNGDDDDDRLQTTMTTSCKSFTEFSIANAAGAYIDYKHSGIILVGQYAVSSHCCAEGLSNHHKGMQCTDD